MDNLGVNFTVLMLLRIEAVSDRGELRHIVSDNNGRLFPTCEIPDIPIVSAIEINARFSILAAIKAKE